MTLRRKYVLYIAGVHLLFAAAMAVLLWDQRIWFIAVEAFLIASGVIAFRLFKGLFHPLELLLAGADSLKEKDFATRLRLSGQPEMDALIGVYNRMIETLQDERLALEEQHFFLQKIMAASPAGIVTLDYDGRVSMMNPAAGRFLLKNGEDVVGKRLGEIDSPLASALARLDPGHSGLVPLRGIRRVKCIRSEFLDRGFPRTFFLLEELTEELRQSEKSAYEKLIRMMSHEVNNSIGAANSLLHSSLHYRDQLREEDRDDFSGALTIAISRTEHLNAFMKGFADIVRLPEPVRHSVDLVILLEDTCALMKPECDKRAIALRREFGPAGLLIREIDRGQMEQVLVNIIKNSIEAIGRAGAIAVRLERKNGGILLAVEDSGPGIPEEIRHLIFTPFFSSKETGQGIGLTLVKEILSRHRFEFGLEGNSEGPTRFTILIP